MDSIKTTFKGLWNGKNFVPVLIVIVCIYTIFSAWTTTIGRTDYISAREGLERVESLLGDIGGHNEKLIDINERLESANQKLIEENRRLTELTEQLQSDIDEYTKGFGTIGDYSLESELTIDGIRQLISKIERYNSKDGISGEATGKADSD